jgi:hypothetical protein
MKVMLMRLHKSRHGWQDNHATNHQEREFVTSNDKPRIVANRYIIEASIDVS